MKHIYIDESGSMTTKHASSNGFFVIALIIAKNGKTAKIKNDLKRFIANNLTELKSLDINNKMFFETGDFKEIKGSELSPDMKIKLAEFITFNKLFEIILIRVDNRRIIEDKFYSNTARAFNYIVSLCLQHNLKYGRLNKDDYQLHIDQRNTKTESLNAFEEHLYIKFVFELDYMSTVLVDYYESQDSYLIQIADFFSNLYFSYLHNHSRYKDTIWKLIENKTIINEFVFPPDY